MKFSEVYAVKKQEVEDAVNSLVERLKAPEPLLSAMKYSLLSGGKRIRPVLTLEGCRIVGGEVNEPVKLIALAVECVHTYSLIHDDLPCMDNDDYRRGKLTSHKVFGEAMAVLAGDSLLNLAYELIFEAMEQDERAAKAGKVIADAIGAKGLIAGQTLDIADNETIEPVQLRYIYQHKTSDLISAAIVAGAILGGGSDDEVKSLREYANNFGFAFQVSDDIIDFETKSSTEKNFVGIYGIDVARTTLNESVGMANRHLDFIKNDTTFLKKLAQRSINRKD